MISTSDVLRIHERLIERYGGTKGIRDIQLLESALNRPFASFDGKDLYRTTVDKAAAVIESIVRNHPFLDGNKRVGYLLMTLLLKEEKIRLVASLNDKYDFVINIVLGNLNQDEIKQWIQSRIENR